MAPTQPKPLLGCVDNEMKLCTGSNLECAGQENSNYVFSLDDVKAVQGNYTEWSDWSDCSTSCGSGEKFRTRNCTNPPPAFGGMDCSFIGMDRDVHKCALRPCAVDGNWAEWGNWSACSATCGHGTVHRRRTCDNPAPDNGGKPCAGEGHETAECHMTPCPLDGRWSGWSSWSPCSVTCGNGRQERMRKCDAPVPEFGGKFCDGPAREFHNCEEDDCPGFWSDWSAWSACSKSCGGGGRRDRTRTCQGGATCVGSAQEVEVCKVQDCPVCHKSIDLAFILDASGTIDDSQWKLTKDFVRGVSNGFRLASNRTRISIVSYSTLPRLERSFDDRNEDENMADFLESMSQPRGDTRTDRALKMARDDLMTSEAGARDFTPKAIVIVTDGGDKLDTTAKFAEQRARELKDMDGATIVALGVGDKVDQYELRQLASDPDHAFLVASYDDIIGYVKSAADAVCTAKPPPPPPRWGSWTQWSPCMKTCGTGVSLRSRECLTGANCRGSGTETRKCKVQDCPSCQISTDLAFVLPVSSKINDTEWREVQNFVKGVANAFNISYDGTHVGVLSYSSQATMEMKFNRYYYQSDVLNAIDNIYPEAKSDQGTRMDDAMEIANYELFTPTGGSRDLITKTMIVLVSDHVGDAKIPGILRRLKYGGVTPVAIGVGPDVRHDDLLKIADQKHTFSVASYNDLIKVAEKVVKSACEVPRYLRKLWDEVKKQRHQKEQEALVKHSYSTPPYSTNYQGVAAMPLTPGQQALMGYAQELAVQPSSQATAASQPVYANATSGQQPVGQVTVTPQATNANVAVPPQPTQQVSNAPQPVYSNASLSQQPVQKPVQTAEPVSNAPQPVYSNASLSQQPLQKAAQAVEPVYSNASLYQQPEQQPLQAAQLVSSVPQPAFSNASLPTQPVQKLAEPIYSNATFAPQPVYSNATPSQQQVEQGWSNVSSAEQPVSPVTGEKQSVYVDASVSTQIPQTQYGNASVPEAGYPSTSMPQPSEGGYSNMTARQPVYPQQPQPVDTNANAPAVAATPQGNESVIPPTANQAAVPQAPSVPSAFPASAQVVAAADANASVSQAQIPPAQVQPTFPAAITEAPPAPAQNATAGQAVPMGAPVSIQVTAAPQPAPAQTNQSLQSPEGAVQGAQAPAKAPSTSSAAQPFVCPHAMDLVFALDSSSDVAANQWTQQKEFMKKVADGFQVQESATHAGVVAYSTIPSISMKLGERNVKDEVDKAFDDLPRDPGNRNLVILLEMAKFEVFTKSSGMRTHMPKALVVTVLGPQNDHNTNAAKSLQSFAKQLEISGVKVIAVGSPSIPEDDLRTMTTEAKYAVRVSNLQSTAEAEKVAKIICNVASEYPSTGENLLAAAKPVQVPFSGPVQPTQPPAQSPSQAPVHDTVAPSHSNLAQERTDYPFSCQPVLYYDFGKICGGEIFDESGSGNNGLSRGRVVVEAGYNEDNGLDLSNGFIQLDGLNFKGKPTLAVTIAAWVKAKNVAGPNINEIFVTEAPGISDPTKRGQYHFEILDKGRVRFFQRNMDKTVYGRTTKEGIPENTWVHLAGLYNPISKQALIYINGRPVMDYEQTDTQETDSLSTDWSKAAYIGTFADDQGAPRQFKGALDEFYIFPCALSGDQIVKLKDTHRIPKFIGPYPGVQRDVWRGVAGTTVTDLALHKGYPNHPTETSVLADFDAPKNEGDYYGSRIRGYFVAPYTGTYSFALSGNDEAELFFSGSSREKDKDLFAVVKGSAHNEFSDQPYQESGYIPLEAGKYYWIEALHKEGTRRDSLSVGFTLECPNAPSVLSEKPILKPSLQYKIPGSCAEVKKMWPGYKDDEYMIQMTPSCNPVRLYCHGMNTATPREYITLEAGPERNFASFHRGRLLNFESCSGSVNPEPKLTANYWGTTRFNKIRVDPTSGLVHRDDYQFSKSEGNPVRFGRAGDCFSAASKCHRGKFQLDLTGTGLRMLKEVEWEAWGTPKLPQRLLNVRKSEDGLTAVGECGGSCGGCQPIKEKMYVEPAACTDASSTEAVARQAIPVHRARKKQEKGEKKSTIKHAQKVHIRSEAPYPHTKTFFEGPGLDESEMEVIGHVTKKKKRSESTKKRKKRKRHTNEEKTAGQ